MRTAIDSSVLLTIVNRGAGYLDWEEALTKVANEGTLLICPVVFAECSVRFASLNQFQSILEALQIRLEDFSAESAWLAGQTFKEYRRAGGPRQHMIPDFLIAAHAKTQADQIAAIDRGYLRAYFGDLKLLSPAPKV
jgi:predicted nucleic acid-binding protein